MRSAAAFPACLLFLICFCQCRQPGQQHRIFITADSLLNLTLELQSRIGSPEIRRLHEFQEEINGDLSALSGYTEENAAYAGYLGLYEGLGQCMQACNQFHEEAFLLESALREIMEQIQMKETDPRDLEELLQFETENYQDLQVRIDSSIELAVRQAELFYTLKPEIDKLREQIEPVPRNP